ncbi:hypothetical protein pb186bvf_004391 [Paramecium bursaria]
MSVDNGTFWNLLSGIFELIIDNIQVNLITFSPIKPNPLADIGTVQCTIPLLIKELCNKFQIFLYNFRDHLKILIFSLNKNFDNPYQINTNYKRRDLILAFQCYDRQSQSLRGSIKSQTVGFQEQEHKNGVYLQQHNQMKYLQESINHLISNQYEITFYLDFRFFEFIIITLKLFRKVIQWICKFMSLIFQQRLSQSYSISSLKSTLEQLKIKIGIKLKLQQNQNCNKIRKHLTKKLQLQIIVQIIREKVQKEITFNKILFEQKASFNLIKSYTRITNKFSFLSLNQFCYLEAIYKNSIKYLN